MNKEGITYSRVTYAENVQYHFLRSLEPGSQVYVKVDEMVRPETILSSVWQKSGFRTFNLGEMFKLSPRKVEGLLDRTIGSRVYQGDVIATRKEWGGLREKVFRSPMTGVLVDYDKESSRLTLQYLPQEVKMVSGVFGKVLEIIPDQSIKIGTKADLIIGASSFGTDREGGLMEVGYFDIPLQVDQLNELCKGRIIFGGTKVSIDVLYKALALGVRAIITGGIDYQDFLRLRGTKGRLEDVGISVIATEGFGASQIYKKTYELLKRAEQRHVFYQSKQGMVVLPLPLKELQGREITHDAPFEQREVRGYRVISVGDAVRVLVGTHVGEYGEVKSINEDQTVSIALSAGEYTLKPNQFEIIEFVSQ